jgi:hypothetical protein
MMVSFMPGCVLKSQTQALALVPYQKWLESRTNAGVSIIYAGIE